MPTNTRRNPRIKKSGDSESVTKRLTRLEAEVKRLKALLAARPLIPNAETIAAMEDTKLVGPFHSVEELMADLNADD